MKKKIKARKRKSYIASRPVFCKIDVDEGGKKILRHRGNLEDGFRKFKTLCSEVYQVVGAFEFKSPNIDMNIKVEYPQMDNMKLKYPEMPKLFNKKGEENDEK